MAADDTLGFYELVRRRKMTRAFRDDPVDLAAVDRIVDAARRAPTAGHSQGVEFIVVTDAELRRRIADPGSEVLAASGHQNFVAQAPVHIVILTSPEIYKRRYHEADKQRVVKGLDDDVLWTIPFWFGDAGAAKMLVLLGAVAEGLAAAFVGVMPTQHAATKALLQVPDDYEILGVVLLGHAAADADDYGDVSAESRRRRPFGEVVHRNGFRREP